MEAPTGVLCALVTPFNADGTPDLGALAELVEFQVQGGAAGLFVLGTTGEGVLLDASERRQLAERLAGLPYIARRQAPGGAAGPARRGRPPTPARPDRRGAGPPGRAAGRGRGRQGVAGRRRSLSPRSRPARVTRTP